MIARMLGRSPLAQNIVRRAGGLVELGTAGYPPKTRRRLRNINVACYTIAVSCVLFALTFVTSIAALLLYDPVLNDADYILGGGADTRVQLGALCEIFLAITNIGTAVVLWPIVKRQSETLALSYVASGSSSRSSSSSA